MTPPLTPEQIALIARNVVMMVLDELASRGGFDPRCAASVLAAMAARDYGCAEIARFPHKEKARDAS